MFLFNRKVQIETERLLLRSPTKRDFHEWARLRYESRAFLKSWDPTWARDHLTRQSFARRVAWAEKAMNDDSAYPMFLFRKTDNSLLGAITLDNVRRGPSQVGTIGYWMGYPYIRRGHMAEAVGLVLDYAFNELRLHRVEAACLVHNDPSSRLLLKLGFTEEGLARQYLCIDGRWQDHRTFGILRSDRPTRN